jgi:PKD repeat protein
VIAAVNGVGQGANSSEVNATPFSFTPPECRIVTSIVNGSVGTDFSFTCIFNAAGAEARWDFGDGNVTEFSSNLTAIHSYDRTGEYTVRVDCRDIHNRTANASSTISVQSQSSGTNNTPIILLGLVALLAVVAVAGLYLMRRRDRMRK